MFLFSSGCACCAELWDSGSRALAVVRAVQGAAGRERQTWTQIHSVVLKEWSSLRIDFSGAVLEPPGAGWVQLLGG